MTCFGYSAHAAAQHGVGANCMSWDTQRCLQLKEIMFAELSVCSDVTVANCDGGKLSFALGRGRIVTR